MSSTAATAPVVNYGAVESPFLVGMLICCSLYGISCAQTVFYYRTYPDDALFKKALIGFLIVLETIHLMLVAEASHFFYVVCKLPENVTGMFFVRTTFAVSFAFTVVLTNFVQAFYIYRVWIISKGQRFRVPVVAIISATSFVHFCLGVVGDVFLYIHRELTFVHGPIIVRVYSSQLAVAMFCDISISLALVVYLHNSRSGFKATGNVVDRLILYSINVGILTSAVSVCTFVTFHASPTTVIFTLFTEIISKVYVNSLLVMLNSRKSIRKIYNERSDAGSYQLASSVRFTTPQNVTKDSSATNVASSREGASFSVNSAARDV